MVLKLGIIGGTGLEDPELLENARDMEAINEAGMPSSSLRSGLLEGLPAVIISRHGRGHGLSPTRVPNRANILALKAAGCSHIIASTAVGSLREDIRPGDFVLPDQFIDFTRRRELSACEDFSAGMRHTAMPEPFDAGLRATLSEAARVLGIPCREGGTVITIEGPRFSTRAESRMYRIWGADMVNMSTAPECAMANELGLPYAAVAMSTDYDSWREGERGVTAVDVMEVFRANAGRMVELLRRTAALLVLGNGGPNGRIPAY